MGADRLAALIEAQRPNLALWIPVLYGARHRASTSPCPPSRRRWMLAALAGGASPRRWRRWSGPGRWRGCCSCALLLPALGFAAAALRSRIVAAPVLPHEMTANVEGRVIGLDRSASDRPRVLLDRVVIHGLEPDADARRGSASRSIPRRPAELLQPGLRLLGQARLAPPAAPVGARRLRLPPRRLVRADRRGRLRADARWSRRRSRDRSDLRQLAFRLRMAASAHIQARIPGQDGAFAAAILTGDRSGIDRSIEAALRASNLYHIVSISGLHMTLLAAAVFAIIRYGLALVPWLALHWPLKKIAAGAALARRRRLSRHLRLRGAGAALLRDDGDGARRGAARPAGADHALDRARRAHRARARAREPDPGRLPDVLRRDRGAGRGLRGAARAGRGGRRPRPRRAGGSPSPCSGSR